MIIAFIYINFDGTSKNAKKCQKELGTFLSSKKCHEVSKNAKFAFFGTKNARLATMPDSCAFEEADDIFSGRLVTTSSHES